MKVVQTPDWDRKWQNIREEVARALVQTAKEILADNINRIESRVKLDGSSQQPNSEAWVKQKGHDHPLKYENKLVDPFRYTINGMEATGEIPLPVRSLRVRLAPPEEREGVVWSLQEGGRLHSIGYRYWGIAHHFRARFRENVLEAVARGRARNKAVPVSPGEAAP